MTIGMQGADLATQAVTQSLKSVFTGGSQDDIERNVKAQASKVENAALALCDALPGMMESQNRLAAAMPEFKQYANMTPDAFLRDYWHKRPLLIRNAFPDFESPLQPEDLAGLACEESALSRIVMHDRANDRWTLRQGPFQEEEFPGMIHGGAVSHRSAFQPSRDRRTGRWPSQHT